MTQIGKPVRVIEAPAPLEAPKPGAVPEPVTPDPAPVKVPA